MSNFFKVWKIYRIGVSKRSGANKRSRLMKDLSEGLEEGEEDGDGWNSREDEEDSNWGLLLYSSSSPSDKSFISHQLSKVFCQKTDMRV